MPAAAAAIMGQSKNSQTFVFLHVAMEAKKGRDSRLYIAWWVVGEGRKIQRVHYYSVQFCDLLLVFLLNNFQPTIADYTHFFLPLSLFFHSLHGLGNSFCHI